MVSQFFRNHNTIRFGRNSVISYKTQQFVLGRRDIVELKLPSKQLHKLDAIIEKIVEPFIGDLICYDNGIDSLCFQIVYSPSGDVIFLCKVEGLFDTSFLLEKWNECTENLGYMTRAENLKAKIAEHEKSLIS